MDTDVSYRELLEERQHYLNIVEMLQTEAEALSDQRDMLVRQVLDLHAQVSTAQKAVSSIADTTARVLERLQQSEQIVEAARRWYYGQPEDLLELVRGLESDMSGRS